MYRIKKGTGMFFSREILQLLIDVIDVIDRSGESTVVLVQTEATQEIERIPVRLQSDRDRRR